MAATEQPIEGATATRQPYQRPELGRRQLLPLRVQCSWCHSVRVGPWWLDLHLPAVNAEVAIHWGSRQVMVATSATICPRCLDTMNQQVVRRSVG